MNYNPKNDPLAIKGYKIDPVLQAFIDASKVSLGALCCCFFVYFIFRVIQGPLCSTNLHRTDIEDAEDEIVIPPSYDLYSMFD